MKKTVFAFAGFRHNHIFGLYNLVKDDERFEISGAFEKNTEAQKAAEEKGVVFNYQSLEMILCDDNVDIVAVGDYYGARGSVIIAALKAGKHVIADKPLCISLSEESEIRKLAMEKNLTVGLMLDLRSNKNILIVQDIINSNMLGKINNIVFEAQHPLMFETRPSWYFEDGMHGGTINDIAIHGIDLIRRFTNSDIEETIGAENWNFYADKATNFKDSAQFMVKMQNGTRVIADVSYSAPTTFGYTHPSYWHFRIWGQKGLADFTCGGNGVTCYLENESSPITITETSNSFNWFSDFFNAIQDEKYRKQYTIDILESTKQTLEIQKISEKN